MLPRCLKLHLAESGDFGRKGTHQTYSIIVMAIRRDPTLAGRIPLAFSPCCTAEDEIEECLCLLVAGRHIAGHANVLGHLGVRRLPFARRRWQRRW
jgi:hypothetical protein